MDWKTWGIGKAADILVDFILDKCKSKKEEDENNSVSRHIIDIIKNEENQNIILAKSKIDDFNTKSILIVMPGEEAVFINNGKIAGILPEGRHILDTSNYPFLSDMINFISGKKRIHCSSIYFLRITVSQPLDWGTSLQVRDPLQLISTRVMCRGVYRIQIVNSEDFIRYFMGNGWQRLNQQEFLHLLKDEITQFIKAYLTEYIMTRKEEILGVSSKLQMLSTELEKSIKNNYLQYGFKIVSFSISGIDILENNQNREMIEDAYTTRRIEEIEKGKV